MVKRPSGVQGIGLGDQVVDVADGDFGVVAADFEEEGRAATPKSRFQNPRVNFLCRTLAEAEGFPGAVGGAAADHGGRCPAPRR